MRILLINANRFKQPWPVIPFGLSCVAASLSNAGHTIQVLDLCFSDACARDISRAVSGFRPELVGISIRNIDNSAGYNTQFLLESVRDDIVRPLTGVFQGPVIIGGPAVGINGAEMLGYLDLPYAIRGDGEGAIVEFVRRLESNLPLAGVGGLVRRENGQIVEDNPPMFVQDLDALPFVNPGDYIDLAPYRSCDSPLQIQTKRGCALHCTYCTYNRIEGLSYRLRNPERVADDIARLVATTGIRHIEFTDSTFNVPLSHAKAVLRALRAKGLKLHLRTMGLNPRSVDDELVELMKAVGFRDVDLGAEAGSNIALKGLGKNYTKDQVLRAGKLLRQARIPVTWYLLVGAPGETSDTLKETFDTLKTAAADWDLINVGVGVRVYNGAPMADAMREEDSASARDNFFRPVHYSPAAISLDEVKVFVKREALARPNIFMYDEDETTPLWLLRLSTFVLRLVAPHQPVWRLFILLRKIQFLLGINRIKQFRFDLATKGAPERSSA